MIGSLLRRVARFRLSSRPRDLRRDLKEQSTEDFWHRRAKAKSRRLWVVARRYDLGAIVGSARDGIGVVSSAIPSLVAASAFGGFVVAAVLKLEMWLAYRVTPTLLPQDDTISTLGAFPALAVQVSASLLGFYLASVGIVLGTSYPKVSADVRARVFGSARTKLYLQSVGMSIGAGLVLVLLRSFGSSFGYLTVGIYALLVAFSGWAFTQLAFGAFNLFNPIALGVEPLRDLYRAINKLDSKGLTGDEAVLRATSLQANRALRILAELIDLASERASVDGQRLVHMVQNLLVLVQIYAQKKHMLPPASAWFIPEPVYPKWVEADHSAVSIALQTSTPLQARMEPTTDWLERRSAELAGAAIEACVMANDRDAALGITRAAARTAETLAKCYRIEDSIAFSSIIRDRCWAIQSENAAAVAVVAEPPLFLSSLLLGWHEAISSWSDAICGVVSETKWDRASTKVVRIRGPARVWAAAQRLLDEVHAEHEIEGKRVTPDWYLQFALSDACILSLREFAKQLPKLLDDFAQPALDWPSPAVKAMTGAHAHQALAKAQLVTDTIPQAVEDMESLRRSNDPQTTEEFESLVNHVRACRTPILTRSFRGSIVHARSPH